MTSDLRSRLFPTAVSALTLALALVSGEARANGLFPSVSQFVVDPTDPNRMALRTTFGIVFSTDGGKTFVWACEAALHYQDILPSLALPAGGPLVFGIPGGVAHGELGACDFELMGGFEGEIADVTTVRKIPERVLALNYDYITHRTQVWESNDRGASFTPLGEPFVEFQGTTLDVAPSDPDVIYVSGMPIGPNATGRLLRSGDHGETFVAHDVPDSFGLRLPYIGAIDPNNSERVYVRLSDFPGRLKVSDDGGGTFSEPLTIPSQMEAFAVSPDGTTVLVSSVSAGTFRANAETLEFERLACVGVNCLAWNESGLFACGDQAINKFIVGRSLDEGQSFERVLDYGCIRSDYGCDASSTVGSLCPARWPTIETQLSSFGWCDANRPPPPVIVECSAGAGGDGSGGPAAGRRDAGCGCGFADPSRLHGWLSFLVAGVLLLAKRRRRAALG